MRPPHHHASTHRIPRRVFLGATAGALVAPWLRWPRALGAVPEADQQRITAAIPNQAPAKPRRPRKLLVFELNVNYGGHASISVASAAFTAMGEKTGAFSTVISKDPEMFRPESLRQFDAVFFNNNVGNLFADTALRQSLVDFIYSGGGLMGVHGTAVAFTQWPGAVEDWPEFGLIIGARGANHRASDERVVLKLDDPAHPVVASFAGQGFEYRDEFFRVHEPYSRQRLRVLLSMDTHKTDLSQGPAYGNLARADQDYAASWLRQYGRGRSFYCTIAHNPYVFWDPKMLAFYLAAAQFVLGDLEAPTTPSARLTPATRALETIGWRLGLASPAATPPTLFASVDATAAAGLLHLDADSTQEISTDIPKRFDDSLNDDERRQIRFRLDAASVRLLTYRVPELPSDEAPCRRLFTFARTMGMEAIIAPPPPRLDLAEKCCEELDLQLALRVASKSPVNDALKLCQGRSPRLGVFGDVAQWIAVGTDPRKAVQTLKSRLIALEISPSYPQISPLLQRLHALGLRPVMIGLTPGPQLTEVLQTCRDTIIKLSQ